VVTNVSKKNALSAFMATSTPKIVARSASETLTAIYKGTYTASCPEDCNLNTHNSASTQHEPLIMNNKEVIIRKKTVMVSLKIMFQSSIGETEEHHEDVNHDIR
jgi:hypothetical protein